MEDAIRMAMQRSIAHRVSQWSETYGPFDPQTWGNYCAELEKAADFLDLYVLGEVIELKLREGA